MDNTFIYHPEHGLNPLLTVSCEEDIAISDLLANHFEYDPKHWTFRVFPACHIPYLYHNLPKTHITSALRKTYDEQLPLIEMCVGDFSQPLWVPVTDDINISALKRAWARLRAGAIIKNYRHEQQRLMDPVASHFFAAVGYFLSRPFYVKSCVQLSCGSVEKNTSREK